MRYLLSVSLCCLLFIACSTSKTLVTREKTDIPFWTSELRDTVKKNDFRVTFSAKKASITGIYIVKKVNGTWKGTIINEFGLKVLDFASTPQQCELLNVIIFLNKYYIRKVISSDIQYIMEIDDPAYKTGIQSDRYWNGDTLTVNHKKARELQRFPNGEMMYKNHKYGLTYSFKRIENTTNTDN